MKNQISILFILAITLPFIGIYCWLKYEKAVVRKTVKHRLMEEIPSDELIQFTFALKDTATVLDWEHSKEFKFQGEMYDIVSRSYTADSVKYYLWWDHEETDLNRKLVRLTNSLINKNPVEQSKNGFISFVIKSVYNEDFQIFLEVPFQKKQATTLSILAKSSTLPPHMTVS